MIGQACATSTGNVPRDGVGYELPVPETKFPGL